MLEGRPDHLRMTLRAADHVEADQSERASQAASSGGSKVAKVVVPLATAAAGVAGGVLLGRGQHPPRRKVLLRRLGESWALMTHDVLAIGPRSEL